MIDRIEFSKKLKENYSDGYFNIPMGWIIDKSILLLNRIESGTFEHGTYDNDQLLLNLKQLYNHRDI